jgi:hypothetical protein
MCLCSCARRFASSNSGSGTALTRPPEAFRHFIEVDVTHLNLSLVAPEIYESLDLGIGNEIALKAFRLASLRSHIEHIAPAQQFLRADQVKNSPGIHLRGDGETDTGRES